MLIYLLTNRVNGKQYVGQTIQPLKKRLRGHRWISSATRKNMAIAHAIQKYGWENFEVTELARCTSQDELDSQEVHFVKTLGTLAPNGYNLMAGGGGRGIMAPALRLKLSLAQKGRLVSVETRKRLSEAHKGITMSESAKAKLSATNKGKKAAPQAYKAAALKNSKTYELVAPDGALVTITNLKNFCRDNDLPYIKLHNVVSGRANTCKGWRLAVAVPRPPVKSPRQGKTYSVCDPQGVVHTTNTLPAFCKEHGLNYTAIFDLLAERKPTHKGWTKPTQSREELREG